MKKSVRFYAHIMRGGRVGRIFSCKRNAIGYLKAFDAIGIVCLSSLDCIKRECWSYTKRP